MKSRQELKIYLKNNKRVVLSLALAIGLFAILLIFDLLSKHFMFKSLVVAGDSKDFIPGFINFVRVENTGAAWGMLAGRPIILIILTIVILIVYLWFYYARLKKHKNNTSLLLSISVGFITGGCIGNLVDRIALGYVRDFINFQFMDFPVFNVADICLTIGVILMIVYFIFFYNREDEYLQLITVHIEKFRDMSEIEKLENKDIIRFSSEDGSELEDVESENKDLDEKLEGKERLENKEQLESKDASEKTDSHTENDNKDDNNSKSEPKDDIKSTKSKLKDGEK